MTHIPLRSLSQILRNLTERILLMKRSKKFKLDNEAINKIDSEYDDRDLSNYTNYEVYE